MTAVGRAGSGYRRWWVVGAAIIGMSSGPAQFAFGSLSLFIIPLGAEFGWDRAEISLASTFFTVALMLALPVLGSLVDRFGSRRLLLPSMVIVGLLLAAIPLTVTALWQLWLIFALIGALGAGANSLPYMRTISAWFDRRRGLALGITLAGAGFGYTYVPPIVQWAIDCSGWRSGYFMLATLTLFVAVPLMYFFFRESPRERATVAAKRSTEQPAEQLAGLTRAEALRTPVFWKLFVVFSLLSFSLYGLLLHSVPLLTDRGMSTTSAALGASTIGITIMIARVIIGYMVDRFFAPNVAFVAFGLSAAGMAVLALGGVNAAAYAAMILIGLSIGAEIDLMTFLASRYFGLRHFGEIFGILFASLLIGTSIGPVGFGWSFETTGSYTFVLWLSGVLIAIATVITITLPAYAKLDSTETTHA